MKPKISDQNTARILIASILAVILFFCTSCFDKELSIEHESYFLKNDRATYSLVEVAIPHGNGPHPIVLMAHGFAGTLHSGGAEELSEKLAEHGILAVMIDFDPYETPDKNAERTHSYPLSQMQDDAISALKDVIKKYDGDPENVSLYGRSYGGRLMMKMANESAGGFDYKKLALVAPAGDSVAFHRYLGGKKKYTKMKLEARNKGYSEKLGIKITPKWFKDVEDYDPTKHGYAFGNKPVLLFYNTKDDVVYPDTSLRCAKAYSDHEIVKVTTSDSHGYEMGYKNSELKDMIMEKLVKFFSD